MRVLGLILSGGKSRRMGRDKGLLSLGQENFTNRAIRRLLPQVEGMAISANQPGYEGFGLPVLADPIADAGPLGGVLAGLEHAAERGFDHVLTIAVDTPFFPHDLSRRLAPMVMAKAHPTFALWPVALAHELRIRLTLGERKLAVVMAELGFREAELGDAGFFNVNSPGDLAVAEGRLRPPLIGVVGFKNAGKTTLTERLVRELTARGYRVSTVKHAHHAFDIDHEGRDSWRHRQAGAHEVAVVSGARFAIVQELRGEPEPSLAEVVARLGACDLIITEGYKWEDHPKIEVRNLEAGHPELAGNDPKVVAVAASGPVEAPVPVFSREDAAGLADFVERLFGLSRPA